MRKTYLIFAVAAFATTLVLPYVSAQETNAETVSDSSTVNISIDHSCEVGLFNFEQPGEGGADPKVLGLGNSGYFTGALSNTGNENASVSMNISVYEVNESGGLESKDVSDQPGNYSIEDELPPENINENNTRFHDFVREFDSSEGDFDTGNYIGEASVNYSCSGNQGHISENRSFIIIDAEGEGEGDEPEEEGEESEADFNMSAVIEAFNKTSDIDMNSSEMENASLSLDALIEQLNRTGQVDTDTNRTEDSELDTDADETSDDAESREGDGDFPGQTPEPEPQPEPTPLLSVSMKPLNSTYQAPRGRFTEVGLEIENIGEESLNNLELEPRFPEEMDWESQPVTVDSLGVGEALNESVYVNPGESVDPGLYQVPVYGSNAETDIDMQYVNVEVMEDVFTEALSIAEAPQDIRFEMGQNYSVPILLENSGEEAVENVDIEVQNSENCGDYTVTEVDSIGADSTASTSIEFTASDELNECSATVIASSEAGSLAFSEINMETVEEVGVVPEEFRIPIVASLWTLMLLAYAVLTKRYGMHSMTVKMPLILLVVGEAFIIVYLSSVYYNLMPPGLLPF